MMESRSQVVPSKNKSVCIVENDPNHNDKFSKSTLHYSVDDILRKKTPISPTGVIISYRRCSRYWKIYVSL